MPITDTHVLRSINPPPQPDHCCSVPNVSTDDRVCSSRVREADGVHTSAFQPQLQFTVSSQMVNGEKYLIPCPAITPEHEFVEFPVRRANDDSHDPTVRITPVIHGSSIPYDRPPTHVGRCDAMHTVFQQSADHSTDRAEKNPWTVKDISGKAQSWWGKPLQGTAEGRPNMLHELSQNILNCRDLVGN